NIFLPPLLIAVTRLNEYIRHYEPVHYDTGDLKRSHARAKRSVTRNHVLDLRFDAHGRHFALRMRRDLGVFSDNLEVIDSRGKPFETQPDTSHVYHGHIVGEPDSYVFGSILDGGLFEGKIISPKSGNYYVEKAARYFRPSSSNSSSSFTSPSPSPSPAPQSEDGFHSVIYREADVEDPYEHMRSGHFGGCGVPDYPGGGTSWMDRISNSGVETPEPDDNNNLEENHLNPLEEEREEAPHEKYSREANTRKKRATRIKDDGRNTCSLFIQTDPLIWKHIHEQVNFNAEKTREEILSLIAHHVTAVNYIYRDTKFDGQIEHRNIKFEVQRIKIDDDLACQPHYQGEVNHFCMENIDVSNFLNLHSLGNHEDFCLAYVFTYRDFTGGTLGPGLGSQCFRRIWRNLREVQNLHGNDRRSVPVDQEKFEHWDHNVCQL
ncbi:hypothetical protein WDU94_007186, partial [Cyamophila willieti]